MSVIAVGIVRVSRVAGRAGAEFASPEIQRERIEQACKTHGWALRDVFQELDVSGGAALEDRPGLREAVGAIERGAAQMIVAAYGDRLFRDVETERTTVRRIERAGGRVWACDRGPITMMDAAGLLTMTLMGAMNENQRLVTKEKTAAGRARAIERGALPIRTPYGYRRNELKQLEPDPALAPLVVRAFELRAAGFSIEKIRETIEFPAAAGRKGPPGLDTVRDWFVWAGYKGKAEYGGQVYEIPALVSSAIWRAAAARGGRRRSAERTSRHQHPGSGLLLARLRVVVCATCGRPMQAQMQQGGKYGTYVCRGGIECAAPAGISSRIADQVIHDRMKERLRFVVGRAGGPSDAAAAREAAEQARDELDTFLGLLSPRAAGLPQTRARVNELEADLARLEAAADAAEDFAAVSLPMAEEWDDLPRDRQRELIPTLIASAEVKPGRGAERMMVWFKADGELVFDDTLDGDGVNFGFVSSATQAAADRAPQAVTEAP